MLRDLDCDLVFLGTTTRQAHIRRPRLARGDLGGVLVQPGDDRRPHAALRVASPLPLQVNVVALNNPRLVLCAQCTKAAALILARMPTRRACTMDCLGLGKSHNRYFFSRPFDNNFPQSVWRYFRGLASTSLVYRAFHLPGHEVPWLFRLVPTATNKYRTPDHKQADKKDRLILRGT